MRAREHRVEAYRRPTMRTSFACAVLGLLLLLAAPLPADVIHLKSGKKWEGEIIKETEKEITLAIGTIKMKIKRADIKKIEKKAYEGKKKKEKPKDEEGKDEAKADAAEGKSSGRMKKIGPPPEKEDIWGYQENGWETPPGKVRQPRWHREKARNTNYIGVLDPPDDVASRVPEDYEAPTDIFSNVYFFQHPDFPQYKIRFYFFKDKLYAIWGKVALDRMGVEINYAEWVDERRKELGGEDKLEADGVMIWDQKGSYAKFTPSFGKPGNPAPTDFVIEHEMVLYHKDARQRILDWAKENLKP
jgi:hypothetical protein